MVCMKSPLGKAELNWYSHWVPCILYLDLLFKNKNIIFTRENIKKVF